jgi:uncharacterized protein YabN with tetrapyrrole methylase and pyrophosphatase domain
MTTLTVVGTGYEIAGQVTVETLRAIEQAQKLFYLVSDPISARWLKTLNSTAESLENSYRPGRGREEIYEEVVKRILTPLRAGRNVCAAYYGHPGVLCSSGHEAVRRARAEGFSASMLPGVSAMDCLFADLEIDPCLGLQTFDATDFVLNRREHDPRSMLVLWQIGLVGVRSYLFKDLWSRAGLRRLTERLRERYSRDHEVVLYEMQYLPTREPVIEKLPLVRLPRANVTIASLLYVPPK